MRKAGQLVVVMSLLALLAAGTGGRAAAQEAQEADVYRIGPGDVLRLNVPQLPDLDGEIAVQPDGSIYVRQVGVVVIGGLTVAEAQEVLLRRLRLFDTSVAEVVLGVLEFNALRIFAHGAVSNPGAHTFESPPTLWDVLRVAGGPTANANLSSCRVLSQEDGRLISTVVDLSGYITGAGLPEMTLRGGDTLVVPLISDGTVGIPAAQGVQVFGGVGQPTTVPLQEPTELVTVLMLAGAPLVDAKLHEVEWVHRGGSRRAIHAQRVDMRDFLRHGDPAGNPMIHPGDVVYMPHERPGWLREYLPLILSVVATTTTALLAYDRISE